MDDTYLIEIRLARTKWRIKQTVFSIARSFSIHTFMESHPHVTLYGPLVLNPGVSREELLGAVEEAGSRFGPVPFTVSSWQKKEGLHGSVIAFSVIPSEDLRELTREVAHRVTPLCTSLNGWDSDPEQKWFHVTVANGLEREHATTIFSILDSTPGPDRYPEKRPLGTFSGILFSFRRLLVRKKPRPYHPEFVDETGLRITVMNGNDILAEYDLGRKQWIEATEGSSSISMQETLREFRKQAGFELADAVPADPGDIFVISDLHFGHANIIRHCCRPFSYAAVGEMDSVIIDNWNFTVPLENGIWFLGDLCYGKDAKSPEQYLDLLNGKITLIRGNHDDVVPGTIASAILDYGSFRFLLVHDPADAPPDFDGWVIHGHHHNNNLAEYPFINFGKRRINVSAEVVGYTPISMREIAARIEEGEKTGKPGHIHLRYPYIH